MSTSETFTIDAGPCPCGNGRIAKHVTSQDNPWSSVDIHYSLECPTCSKNWQLRDRYIVQLSSEGSHNAARAKQSAVSASLKRLVNELVSDYFHKLSAKSKKAEHAEMTRLGITSLSYNGYLKHRRQGGTIEEAASGIANRAFLLAEAAAVGKKDALVALLSGYDCASKDVADAAAQIVRKRVD